jgi:hypothetical protein
MSEPATKSNDGPDRRGLPIVTMLGAALSFFLFVVLVGVMFYINKQFYAPRDDIAERAKLLKELRDGDQTTLTSYGKTDKGYRVPIDRAILLVIDESKKQAAAESTPKKEPPK